MIYIFTLRYEIFIQNRKTVYNDKKHLVKKGKN